MGWNKKGLQACERYGSSSNNWLMMMVLSENFTSFPVTIQLLDPLKHIICSSIILVILGPGLSEGVLCNHPSVRDPSLNISETAH